jgi:hypothetical protein
MTCPKVEDRLAAALGVVGAAGISIEGDGNEGDRLAAARWTAAGDGPCAILMVGARGPDKTLNYPVTELARKHGVAAPEETSDPREAYRDWPRSFRRVRATWPV